MSDERYEPLRLSAVRLLNILNQADPSGTSNGHADFPLRIICDNQPFADELCEALQDLQTLSGWKRPEP